MASSAPQAHDFWPFFPLLFVSGWIAVSFIISHTGWRSFSSRYPARSRPPGRVYTSPLSWFGSIFISYRNVVRIVFTDTGIYLYALFLFRAFHPPFLVPWASVRRVVKRDGFLFRGYQLDIEDAAGEIHVLLPRKVEDELFRYHKAA